MTEMMKWEKPMLTVLNSAALKENVLGSSGGDVDPEPPPGSPR